MLTNTVCQIVVSFYLSERVVRFSSAFSTHEGYTTAASSITNIPVLIDSNLFIFQRTTELDSSNDQYHTLVSFFLAL